MTTNKNHNSEASRGNISTPSQTDIHCSGSTGMGQDSSVIPPGQLMADCTAGPAQSFNLRSVQESTQMLYDVFDYTIGMLEELEKHEGHPGKNVPPNSGIFPHLVPLDHKMPEPKVIAGIEAELQCLSIQMWYLPKDVINDSTRKQLVDQTLEWLAARQEMKVPGSKVEWYCKNILEIVLLMVNPGEMPPRKPTEITNSEQSPNKIKAKLRPKRRAKMKVSLCEGAKGLPLDEDKDNDLIKALHSYLYGCQCDKCTRCHRNQENHVSRTHGIQHNSSHISNHGSQAPGNTGMPNQVATPSHPGLCEDQKDTEESMECTFSIHEPVQLQESLHRSVQASAQMLYDVFDYTIGMLEELEKHEGHPGKNIPPNSGIFPHLVPLNHKKPEPEVIAGIEAELQCLSIQMRYLPKDVINDSTRKKLVDETLQWLGGRQEMKVPHSIVEWYCKNILEIVVLGVAREMPPRKHPLPTAEINGEQVNEALFQMARARHFGEQQDQQFHKDPNKKAKLRSKRRAKIKVSLREGANRLPLDEHKDNDLLDALVPYVFDVGVDTT